MLYQLYEVQRAISEPFADFAKATSKLFSNPSLAFSQLPLSQRIAATYDLLYRLGKDYEKPAFGIETVPVDGVEVAIHERIEMDKPFCELRRFKRFSDNPQTLQTMLEQPVVLVVAPLSGHYATLLRETVRMLLSGHKVYITDWKNARMVPLSEGDFHLDDYVNYVQAFIRHLQAKHGNVHVMSVCQPTVPVLAAISLMASRGETTPLSMVMMGGPIDARQTPTTVNNLATERSFEWFENNLIYRVPYGYPGEGRRVYPGFLQYTGFVAMNPNRHASSHYDYFRNLIKGDEDATEHHRKFYDEYNAVLDMDANYYLETIDTVFQKYRLVEGTWQVRNPEGALELVRPQDIRTTALITVEGELDDISGIGQTRAAHRLCTGIPATHRAHLEVPGAGHYGIFSGSRWRKIVYPELAAFFRRFEPARQTDPSGQPIARPGTQAHVAMHGDDPAPSATVQPTPSEPATPTAAAAKPSRTPAAKAPVRRAGSTNAKRSRTSAEPSGTTAAAAADAPAATPAHNPPRTASGRAAAAAKRAGRAPDSQAAAPAAQPATKKPSSALQRPAAAKKTPPPGRARATREPLNAFEAAARSRPGTTQAGAQSPQAPAATVPAPSGSAANDSST
ncbi:polyhydroxyalkanoate depolymerase [Lampropedia cohaerens]|uniref:polyhydroxyalkanoate depolymerase n=1 Tax=Lampropedia cohaerens TaxID=1610491 RepID=UPI000A07D101|nr:polyhydroxyalkanoate depolymerase [Lampropedia cohaerens]